MTAPTTIYNLCSNPQLHAKHCVPINCTITDTMYNGTENVLMMTATNNSQDAEVSLPPIDVSKLNGVTMYARVYTSVTRYGAEYSSFSTVCCPAICYVKFNDGQLIGPPSLLKGAAWVHGIIQWDFTVPDGMKTITPVVTAPADSSSNVWWSEFMISTLDNAKTLSNATGTSYFDGSTRPE